MLQQSKLFCLSEESSEELYPHVLVSHLRIIGTIYDLLWVLIELNSFSHGHHWSMIPRPCRMEKISFSLDFHLMPMLKITGEWQGVSLAWGSQFNDIFWVCFHCFGAQGIPAHGVWCHGWMSAAGNTGIIWEMHSSFKLLSPALFNKWCVHDLLTSVTIC